MQLSALLLTFVIALGTSAPLAAKSKRTPPKVHSRSAVKAPKVKRKPVKPKPMKYRKSKTRGAKPVRTPRARTPRSV